MNKGCLTLFVGLALAIGLLLAYSYASDSATRQTNARANLELAQGRARAMVIEAQAESRLHSAQAFAITAGMLIPFVALGIVGLLGLAIVGLVVVLAIRPKQQPVHYIETRIMYLPPPQATRRELWQMVSDNQPVLIETGKDQNS